MAKILNRSEVCKRVDPGMRDLAIACLAAGWRAEQGGHHEAPGGVLGFVFRSLRPSESEGADLPCRTRPGHYELTLSR